MQGEFSFIERLRAKAAREAAGDENLVLGIGDDAAVWRSRDGYENLITVDLLVEDIDFERRYAVPRLLGHKALAVSLSDLAAMGARPRYSLLTLAVTRDLKGDRSQEFWNEFFAGYFALASRFGVRLIGGDISSAPDRLSIDSILIGECRRGEAVGRAGARAGDAIFVTGALGASAAGLQLLRDGARFGGDESDPVQRALLAHLRPEPRVDFGCAIGERRLARAMIDLSDGLTQDLAHICASSGVSAILDFERVPVAAETALVESDRERAFELAVSGGEDFELLVVAERSREAELRSATGEAGLTLIGEIVEAASELLYLRRGGEVVPLEARGYDHLAD